ncbi:MAG: hypothetical protein KatS3mg131_0486 [Candidatus Tectimicrobiota bacterium]|nr:MAG: hypothetical protein KatS3mg131_0486 [Candidatus Tectomicrobia bacterium]
MVNPFREFRAYTPPRPLPLDTILAQRNAALQRLRQSYEALIAEESKQLVWVIEQGALSRAYTVAVEALRGVDFTVEDLEDMCLELDTADGAAASLGVPSGLFIAAMCNQVQATDIVLDLRAFKRRWPFLGFRLPRGRRLRLEGDAGDFVGALLAGGEVVVNGNVGSYAGLGMRAGLLHIAYSSGKYTGEGMRGGTIRVQGRIGSLGKAKQGFIYEGGQQVFPARSEE